MIHRDIHDKYQNKLDLRNFQSNFVANKLTTMIEERDIREALDHINYLKDYL